MLWGVGLFWLTNAVLTIGDMTYRQKIPFNMGWWVSIYLSAYIPYSL